MSKLVTNQLGHRDGYGTVTLLENNSIVSVGPGTIYAPGTVIQSKTSLSGPAAQTISSLTPVAVSGLSVTIAPNFSNSLMVVMGQIQSNSPHVSSFAVYRNAAVTVSTSGFSNLNQPDMQFTTYTGTDVTAQSWVWPIMHFETAGTTGNITYQVYATAGWNGTARALVINNRVAADMAGFSHITVMEVAQ